MIPVRDAIPPRTTPWISRALLAAGVLVSLLAGGGWLHLGSNTLALWVFGENVEDRMGHWRFLGFALVTGLVAAVVGPHPDVADMTLAGASAAVAGVLGAYVVLFPKSQVLVWMWLIVTTDVVEVPAVFFLGLWFVLQMIAIVTALAPPAASAGASVLALVGAFAWGALAARMLTRPVRWP